MRKLKSILLTAIIAISVPLFAQAQDKPVVILSPALHDQYNQYTSDTSQVKSRIEEIRKQIESIKATFPQDGPDINPDISGFEGQIRDIEAKRDSASKNFGSVEDAIKRTIREAKDTPVVWRTIHIVVNQAMIETYTIDKHTGKIMVTPSTVDLKQK